MSMLSDFGKWLRSSLSAEEEIPLPRALYLADPSEPATLRHDWRAQAIALINQIPKAISRTLLVPSSIEQRDEHDGRDQ